MNDQIRWDPSLIKKFSSSNHFKMLNQLRSEVKKYPLTIKKHLSANISSDNKINSTNNLSTSNNQDLSLNKSNNELYNSQSTISFNNSKNFSIYNKNIQESSNEEKESKSIDINKLNCETNSPKTFKDRLNNIDMK